MIFELLVDLLWQYDAEIVYWESKEREKQLQLDFIAQEIVTVSNTSRITQEQVHNSFNISLAVF